MEETQVSAIIRGPAHKALEELKKAYPMRNVTLLISEALIFYAAAKGRQKEQAC